MLLSSPQVDTRWQRYFFTLVPATVLYFLGARIFQDRFVPVHPRLDLAYPGYPLRPEPWEIPLYLLGYVVIPLLAWFLAAALRRRAVRYLLGGAAVIIALSVIPYARVVTYVRALPGLDYFARRSVWDVLWLLVTKRLYIVRLAVGVGLLFGLAAWLWPRSFSAAIQRWQVWPEWKKFVPYFFVLIACLLFDPNFPYIEGNSNYVLIPAHELLLGRPLLYKTASIYGVLNTYLTALVMYVLRGTVMPHRVLALVTTGLYLVFFLLLYQLVKRWLGSTFYAILATWFGLVVGFLLLADPYITPYDITGENVFRLGFYVAPALALVYCGDTRRRIFQTLALLAAAVGLFWNVEMGIFITAATFVAFAVAAYAEFGRPLAERLRNFAVLVCRQVACIAGVWGVIMLVNYLRYGAFPSLRAPLFFLGVFEGGYGKLPMPGLGLYEVIIIVYLLTLSWAVYRLSRRQPVAPILIFFAVYGALSLLYYVGNSAWSYLNFVSLPALLLVLFALRGMFQPAASTMVPRIAPTVMVGLLAFMLTLWTAKVGVTLAYRDYATPSLRQVDPQDRSLYRDANFLREHFPQTEIALFHQDDGKLLLWSNTMNQFDYPDLEGNPVTSLIDDLQVVFRPQIEALTRQLEVRRPERVFITRRSDPRVADLEAYVQRHYTVEWTLETLKVYRLQ